MTVQRHRGKKWKTRLDRLQAFERVFGTPDGEAVLSHLCNQFGLHGPLWDIDPEVTRKNAAQWDVVKYILDTLSLTVEEALVLDARTDIPYDPLAPQED